MDPVIIHADGTDCHHEGAPQSGGLCPAGLPVTHIRFNGQVLTIEQAVTAVMKMADAFADALRPFAVAFAEFGRRASEIPALRTLAAIEKDGPGGGRRRQGRREMMGS